MTLDDLMLPVGIGAGAAIVMVVLLVVLDATRSVEAIPPGTETVVFCDARHRCTAADASTPTPSNVDEYVPIAWLLEIQAERDSLAVITAKRMLRCEGLQ